MAQAQHNHPLDVVEGDLGAAFVGGDRPGRAVGDNVAPQPIHIELGADLRNAHPVFVVEGDAG